MATQCTKVWIEQLDSGRTYSVWTDACATSIEAVEGVSNIRGGVEKHQLLVTLDPRYNAKDVLDEIRALV